MKKLFLLLITISSFAFSGASLGCSLVMVTVYTGGYGDVKMNIPTLNGGFSGREGNFGWEAKLGVGLTEGSDDDNDGDEWTIEIDRFIQLKGKYFFQKIFMVHLYTQMLQLNLSFGYLCKMMIAILAFILDI